ncbi:MAG: hypothetical protein M3Y41_01665 [Pseudomonadota bacterium]|nr:hypothetical protein [Pseudomonadota bacterium]
MATNRSASARCCRHGAAGKSASEYDPPEKLIYPLEHAYTPAELGFPALKGADAAVAGVLVAAARQSGCDLHLALVTIEESGSAEHTGDFGSHGRWSAADEDEFEAGELDRRYVTLSEWRSLDGAPALSGSIPVEDEELSPPDAFDDLEPDEEHFREATGNEGASFERSYRRAAPVLWPRERISAVLCQAGLAVTLPYLGDLARRWGESTDRLAPLRHQAHDLAAHMIARWPNPGWLSRESEGPSDAAQMLTHLTRLEDTAAIDGSWWGSSPPASTAGATTKPSSARSRRCRRRSGRH